MKSGGKKLTLTAKVQGATRSMFPRRIRGELQLQDKLGNVLLRTSVR